MRRPPAERRLDAGVKRKAVDGPTEVAWLQKRRRDVAAAALRRIGGAMRATPLLVAGTGRLCTTLMRACPDVVAKTGAEGVFVAILPELRLGLAVKIEDGAGRAAEAAVAALLVRLGALPADHPATRRRLDAAQVNCRGTVTGTLRAAEGFPGGFPGGLPATP